MKLKLTVLKDIYAIYKLLPDTSLPEWVANSVFYSITKTGDELSIVCKQNEKAADSIVVSRTGKFLK